MTLTQIVNSLKNMIGPAGRGSEVDDGGLAVWVNEAYDMTLDEINKAVPDFFTTRKTASTITGQAEYALPTDFIKMVMVNIKLDGVDTRAINLANINQVPIASSSESQGFSNAYPRYYLTDSKLGIRPIPAETTANNITIWYTYLPEELDDADEPAFPRPFHHILKYWAYANYLDQNDEHVAAERMRIRFETSLSRLIATLEERNVDQGKAVVVTTGNDLFVGDSQNYN